MSEPTSCAWCGRAFKPRATGGKAQQFCHPACRRALDTACRRWIAAALASGTLTIDSLKESPRRNARVASRRHLAVVDTRAEKPAS